MPGYFAKLLGAAPKGLSPARTPRQVYAPVADVWDPYALGAVKSDGYGRDHISRSSRPVVSSRPAQPVSATNSPETHTPPSAPVPTESARNRQPVSAQNLDDAIAIPAAPRGPAHTEATQRPSLVPSRVSPQAPVSAPEFQRETSKASIQTPSSPLDSVFHRVTSRYLAEVVPSFVGDQDRSAPSAEEPKPAHVMYPASLPSPPRSSTQPLPYSQGDPPTTIEIGQIEVRIHPAAPINKPPSRPAARPGNAGQLTRSHYVHGLRQG